MRHTLAACSGLLLVAGNAIAQTPSNSAEALFRAGRQAMKDGETADACEHFNASFALQRAAGTQLNLAICEEQLGNLVRAYNHHRELQQTLADDDPRRAIVEERRRHLAERLAVVAFELAPTAPPGTVATNRTTGEPLDLGSAIPFASGEYVIEVSAPDHSSREYPLRLAASERRTVVIEPGAAQPSPRPERETEKQPDAVEITQPPAEDVSQGDAMGFSRSSWAGISLGVGGAAFLTSGVAAMLVLREKNVVERECTPTDGGRECSARGLHAGDRGRLYSTAGTTAFAVGVVSASIGAYLLLSDDAGVSAELGPVSRITFAGRF